MKRKRHPNKEVESAIQYAESKGWRYIKTGKSSHAWGRLRCPEHSALGCQLSIWSTPSVPEHHAKIIRKIVDNCPH